MTKEFIKLKNSKGNIYYRIILNELVYGQIQKDEAEYDLPWSWFINVDGSMLFVERCETLKEAKSELLKEINMIDKQYLEVEE